MDIILIILLSIAYVAGYSYVAASYLRDNPETVPYAPRWMIITLLVFLFLFWHVIWIVLFFRRSLEKL